MSYICKRKSRMLCVMTYLNQFHKEATERTLRKIEESKKSPMNSKDFAAYMKKNLEIARQMETGSKQSNA